MYLRPSWAKRGGKIYSAKNEMCIRDSKYIEQSPHPRINPFYKHPLFSRECEQEYKQALKETGVEISSFIVVYRWSGPTEEQRQFAVANWKRMIQIAVDMGAVSYTHLSSI